jgi:hypothetical protein
MTQPRSVTPAARSAATISAPVHNQQHNKDGGEDSRCHHDPSVARHHGTGSARTRRPSGVPSWNIGAAQFTNRPGPRRLGSSAVERCRRTINRREWRRYDACRAGPPSGKGFGRTVAFEDVRAHHRANGRHRPGRLRAVRHRYGWSCWVVPFSVPAAAGTDSRAGVVDQVYQAVAAAWSWRSWSGVGHQFDVKLVVSQPASWAPASYALWQNASSVVRGSRAVRTVS